jgi:hypothetical protein
MAYQNPRNADELKLQELQAERSKLQAAIEKGITLEDYIDMGHQVQRLRTVKSEINHLYVNRKGL